MAWSETSIESSFQQDRLPEGNTVDKEINYGANIVSQGGHDDEKTFRFKAVKMKTTGCGNEGKGSGQDDVHISVWLSDNSDVCYE